MRDRIVANVRTGPTSSVLTTADVARMLERTAANVRWLASTGRLPSTTTRSGQRLYRESDVLRLVAERSRARLRNVYVMRPKLFIGGNGPRQLSLFGGAKLRMVAQAADSKSFADPQVRGPESTGNACVSDKRS